MTRYAFDVHRQAELVEMEPDCPWTEFCQRALLDEHLHTAATFLRALDDEKTAAQLERLRERNVGKMARIQKAAYQIRAAKIYSDA